MVTRHLDRLIELGEITGYTREPEPTYLTGGVPTLTYSMYDSTPGGRQNLEAFAADVSRLGARFALHSTNGNVASPRLRVHRSTQATIRATFPSAGHLAEALHLVRQQYIAGQSSRAMPFSWRVPDVRIAGVIGLEGAIGAFAHTAPVDGDAVVVLTLARRPPLPGMTTHPVNLLPAWRRFLAITGR